MQIAAYLQVIAVSNRIQGPLQDCTELAFVTLLGRSPVNARQLNTCNP
jgi:hypothetical protein